MHNMLWRISTTNIYSFIHAHWRSASLQVTGVVFHLRVSGVIVRHLRADILSPASIISYMMGGGVF